MFPNEYIPPLYTEIGYLNNEREGSGEVSSFYKEIKAKLGLGDMDDKENNEELKKLTMEALEGITKHFMQVFELLASKLGSKSAPGSSNSTPHDERKTHGEAIFSNRPHNRPHEFKNQNGPEIPKFLESKEGPYTTYDVREATNDWQQLSDECMKVLPFVQFN